VINARLIVRAIIHVHLHKPRSIHDSRPVAVGLALTGQLIPGQVSVVAAVDVVAEDGQVHVLVHTLFPASFGFRSIQYKI